MTNVLMDLRTATKLEKKNFVLKIKGKTVTTREIKVKTKIER